MVTLDALLHQFAPDVLDRWHDCGERRWIDRRSVRRRYIRCHGRTFDRPRQERGGRGGVAGGTDVDVDDLTFLV
jgi:hypothetical protein